MDINLDTNKTENNLILSEKISYKIDVRPYFLTNGTLRPDPVTSQSLAIWPEEGDPEDDRIINQLMYVPMNYSPETAKTKTIYLIVDDWDWKLRKGNVTFKECPVSSCAFVDWDEASNADLVFFKVSL